MSDRLWHVHLTGVDQVLSYSITNQESYRILLRDLYREMSHPFLDTSIYTQSTDRVLVALADVLAATLNQDVLDWYPEILAILLIHRGLHVHATVPDQPVQLVDQQRQLTVLAGDYFSSKYYRILVENGLLSLVAQLAGAIQEINEAKTDLRMHESLDSTTLAEQIQVLSATTYLLFNALYDYKQIPLPESQALIRLVAEIVPLLHAYEAGPGQYVAFQLHERLLWQQATQEERKYLKKLKYGQPFDGKVSSWFIKYNTKRSLEHMLHDSLQKIRSVYDQMKRIAITRLDEAFMNLVNSIELELSSHKRAVEEG